eukprot:Protomagalhaensia_wolfi_Nauph_80__6238@NODE_943_length_1861_cov_520_688255_g712_i0_p1_GENE_NODE_943_length_1861_cov_520_688255_g712_i0NODE_943_length_1861_cov_520_688255_g712_i0_p1_ORF_typecomplete_len213_score23_38Ribosomal_L37ae/PF01780_19/5_5e36zfRING_13/PF17977_1/0_063_NODE_943_length_1861_cov_520_688255_g712_i07801418
MWDRSWEERCKWFVGDGTWCLLMFQRLCLLNGRCGGSLLCKADESPYTRRNEAALCVVFLSSIPPLPPPAHLLPPPTCLPAFNKTTRSKNLRPPLGLPPPQPPFFSTGGTTEGIPMARRTKKVGIAGKYGVRYGSSLRKMAKKFETLSHARYVCTFCGKSAVKRQAVGIWKCRACEVTCAGGAWTIGTTAAATARSTLARLRKAQETAPVQA